MLLRRPAVSPFREQLEGQANLGGEVPVEYAFGVQVSQAACNLTSKFHPRGPTQVLITV